MFPLLNFRLIFFFFLLLDDITKENGNLKTSEYKSKILKKILINTIIMSMASFGKFYLLARIKPSFQYGYNCIARYCSSYAPPRIGIVGSGPAGFYTAQHILKVFIFIIYFFFF